MQTLQLSTLYDSYRGFLLGFEYFLQWCIIHSHLLTFYILMLCVSVRAFDKYTVIVCVGLFYFFPINVYTPITPTLYHVFIFILVLIKSISVDIDTIYNDYWNFYLLQLSQWPYNGSLSTGWRSHISSQISVLNMIYDGESIRKTRESQLQWSGPSYFVNKHPCPSNFQDCVILGQGQ